MKYKLIIAVLIASLTYDELAIVKNAKVIAKQNATLATQREVIEYLSHIILREMPNTTEFDEIALKTLADKLR